jgi:hypothetical protein
MHLSKKRDSQWPFDVYCTLYRSTFGFRANLLE